MTTWILLSNGYMHRPHYRSSNGWALSFGYGVFSGWTIFNSYGVSRMVNHVLSESQTAEAQSWATDAITQLTGARA